MYRRILVPLDGSKTAEAVLPYARRLVGDLKAPVELLTVIDLAELSKHVHAEKLTNLDEVIKDQVVNAEKYLSGVASSFQGENISYRVEKGETAGTILSKAETDKGTLITMATHGRTGLKRWLLGSIAEKVLRATNNPLLLIRANKEAATNGKATLDSVMIPLDGSELAESILPYAVELAKIVNLKLRLMRSYYTTGVLFNYEDYLANLKDLPARSKNEAIGYLDAKVEQLETERLSNVASFVAEGEPAQMILEGAAEIPNCVIAMCTHGRSGVDRWMLGSVTEKVMRHSGNPVLVIRAR